MRRLLIPATVVGLVLGIPMLVLQRWVAETRFAAIVLVLAWFAIVGVALAVYLVRHRQARLPASGAYVVEFKDSVRNGPIKVSIEAKGKFVANDEAKVTEQFELDGPDETGGKCGYKATFEHGVFGH